jgi:cyclopropane-fatty-acyl-phospholipid synthase
MTTLALSHTSDPPDTQIIHGVPPFVAALLRRWLGELTGGRLKFRLPGGQVLAFGAPGGLEAAVTIRNVRALWRVATSGSVGWAESYMAGEWDCDDLSAFLLIAARNLSTLAERGGEGTFIARLFHRLMHLARANTRAGSRRNIAAHYDLGNEFYAQWLDPSMTYSSALFAHPGEALETAQLRKYRRLCERLQLRPGDHVLEIGCGWGGFAETAARDYGCRVTALTVSERQAAFARERIARRNLASQVEIRLQDYRDLSERYDAIASVEMFEAVGQENWPTYFAALRRSLAPGGRAAIQTITIADSKFDAYRRGADFIQRYIFPGGMLPSPGAFRAQARAARFTVADEFFFGADYAETLRRWSDMFNRAWPSITGLGFDERFKRMWNYYLSYCEAGFDAGHIDVAQILLVRD